MTAFLYYVIPFICVLGILIFFHELGHFLVAKYFKVKVQTFSLGFGPKILSRRWGETEYVISALPLGGYVKMLGEENDEDTAGMPPEEVERSFGAQPVGKRLAIVAAGPVANLLLAVFVFIVFYMAAGTQELTAEVGQVTSGSPAHAAGIQKGDIIKAVGKIDRTVCHIAEHAEFIVSLFVRTGIVGSSGTQSIRSNRNVCNTQFVEVFRTIECSCTGADN